MNAKWWKNSVNKLFYFSLWFPFVSSALFTRAKQIGNSEETREKKKIYKTMCKASNFSLFVVTLMLSSVLFQFLSFSNVFLCFFFFVIHFHFALPLETFAMAMMKWFRTYLRHWWHQLYYAAGNCFYRHRCLCCCFLKTTTSTFCLK